MVLKNELTKAASICLNHVNLKSKQRNKQFILYKENADCLNTIHEKKVIISYKDMITQQLFISLLRIKNVSHYNSTQLN